MKKIYIKNTGPHQATIARSHIKVNSILFDDPYDHNHHMEHTHENTHLIDTQEQDMENNDFEQDEVYEETNYDLITEKELENIHPYLDNNLPSTKMKSRVMSIHQNYP